MLKIRVFLPIVSLCCSASIGILYLLTLSSNYSLAHDSISYLRNITTGKFLVHPHHILYSITNHIWVQTIPWGTIPQKIAFLNTIAAVFALFAFLLIVHRASSSLFAAICSVFVLGGTFGFWYYSVCIETYLIPLSLLLWSFHLATNGKSITSALLSGTLTGFAVGFHILSVLMIPVIGVAALMRRSFRKDIYCYLFCSISIGLFCYLAAWFSLTFRPPTFWEWLSPPGAGNNHGILVSLLLSLLGIFRSVIGGHFLFSLPGVSSLTQSFFPNHYLSDEFYFGSYISAFTGYTCLSLLFSIILLLIVTRPFKFSLFPSIPTSVSLPFVLWIAIYSPFITLFEPANPEFWIFTLPAFLVLLSIYFSALKRAVIVLVVVMLWVINGLGTVVPASRPHSDYYQLLAMDTNRYEGTPATILIIPHEWIYRPYLSRYSSFPAERILTVSRFVESFNGEVTRVILPRESEQLLKSAGFSLERLDDGDLTGVYNIRLK